ncbi:ribonuclease H-like domain-containing protein [Tanacetum coccineum]|uniref:Ribonuclease H-like domain-containing protein n=1 Tax=Tanacetum coccineum TaxID=301880 RepID=A0ABQ5E3R1_9ASTR
MNGSDIPHRETIPAPQETSNASLRSASLGNNTGTQPLAQKGVNRTTDICGTNYALNPVAYQNPLGPPVMLRPLHMFSLYLWFSALHPAQPSHNVGIPPGSPPLAYFIAPTDGTLSRYKARLVANGSTQLKGVDVDEIFSPVVKQGTIRTVLSLATSRHWPIHQLDVKNVFLHAVSLWAQAGPSSLVSAIWMFLSKRKYVVEILEQAHMTNCNPIRTPVDTESKLGVDGDPVSDLTLYQSLARSLQILRYIRDTLDYGLQLFASSTTSLVAYLDADWASCSTTRRFTSGYCVFLGNNLLLWSSNCQPTLSHSSVDVEYRGVANVVAETCWLRNLLRAYA